MRWFRTTRRLVPWLIGVFAIAQLSGAVPFRQAHASAAKAHVHAHDHAGHSHAAQLPEHAKDGAADRDSAGFPGMTADPCCALHGLAAIVPMVLAVIAVGTVGERITERPSRDRAGISPGRLDRPPRTLPFV